MRVKWWVSGVVRSAGLAALLVHCGCVTVYEAQRRASRAAAAGPITPRASAPVRTRAASASLPAPRPPAARPQPRPRLPPGPPPVRFPLAPAAPTAAEAAPHPSAPASFRTILVAQIFLDRQNLSCGSVDGVLGSRTRAALKAWQTTQGGPATGEMDQGIVQATAGMPDAFATREVTEQEHAALTTVPDSWVAKSRRPRLGYQTILETVAEQSHASEGAIRCLNPGVEWPDPPAGTRLVAPNPRPAIRAAKAARLTIQIRRKTILAYDAAGGLMGLFPCSIAQKVEKIPTGELRVANCAADPDYTFDPALFVEDPEARTIAGKLRIPPGPNNPVGVAWIGLSLPGYGMHGTPKPEDIGKTESHGCFRLANWNAAKLLRMVWIGMPVTMDWSE